MNYMFHHLPKTGGMGISQWVLNCLGHRAMEFGPRRRSGDLPCVLYNLHRTGGRWARTGLDVNALVGHHLFPQLAEYFDWTEYKAITILRHPAERLFSQWSHHKRNGESCCDTFEEWVRQPALEVGICNCMECFCSREKNHRTNPMMHFYSAHAIGKAHSPDTARDQLKQYQTYDISQINDVVRELSKGLCIPKDKYEPMHVSGAGKKVTDEQRALVRELHPLDVELYEEMVE